MLYARFCHPNNGYSSERENICQTLKVGSRYLVDMISMGQSHTSIFLSGFTRSFNSAYFDFEDEDGTPHNIYKDAKYNPYL